MPYKPPRHQPVAWRPHPSRQASSKRPEPFYATKQWKEVRKFVLDRDGHMCRKMSPRCTGNATTVHHVISRGTPGSSDEPWNLISVCYACHNHDHPEKGR